MSEDKSIKLFKAAKELNIGTSTIVGFLGGKGYKIENKPTTKLEPEMYDALLKEFQGDKNIKEEAKQISIGKIRKEETVHVAEKPAAFSGKSVEHQEVLIKNANNYPDAARPAAHNIGTKDDSSLPGVKVVGKINLDDLNGRAYQEKEPVKEAPKETVKPVEVKSAPVQPEVAKPVAAEPVQQKQPEPVTVPPVVTAPKPEATVKEPVKEAPKAEEPKPAVQVPDAVQAPEVKAPEAAAVTPAPVVVADQAEEVHADSEVIRARADRLSGPNVVGRMTLPVNPTKRKDQPVASSNAGNNSAADHKRKRKRKENSPGQPPHPGQASGTHGSNNAGSHASNNTGSHAPGQNNNQRPPAGGGNRPPFNRNNNNT